MKPVILDPEAEVEVDDALASSRDAAAFRAEVNAAFNLLGANPQIAARIGSSEVRRLILPRLPYSVVYAEEPDVVRVLAFAHHKRRPGYWKHRLRRP